MPEVCRGLSVVCHCRVCVPGSSITVYGSVVGEEAHLGGGHLCRRGTGSDPALSPGGLQM